MVPLPGHFPTVRLRCEPGIVTVERAAEWWTGWLWSCTVRAWCLAECRAGCRTSFCHLGNGASVHSLQGHANLVVRCGTVAHTCNPSTVAHTCNPSTLEVGQEISSSKTHRRLVCRKPLGKLVSSLALGLTSFPESSGPGDICCDVRCEVRLTKRTVRPGHWGCPE
jgi:hypothetical protein